MAKREKKSPEQTEDDNNRTTSAGLFHTAEAWRSAAMALARPKLIGHEEKPVRFLYYHALELYLKALLRQKHGIQTLIDKFGHDFNRDSPDESPTGVDIRGFPAFLQDGRAVWIDAVTAATWTGVEGADLATSLAFGHTPAVGLLERMGY